MSEGFATSAWTQIIGTAATSSLGIAALVILVMGFVTISLIGKNDSIRARLGVIVLLLLFCGGLVTVAFYTVRPTAPRPAIVAKAPPTPAELPSAPPSAAPPPEATSATAKPARVDCGAAWSGWIDVGGGVGNPCPSGCSRGEELGQSYRVVGFPPRPQTQHKFQCWRG